MRKKFQTDKRSKASRMSERAANQGKYRDWTPARIVRRSPVSESLNVTLARVDFLK